MDLFRALVLLSFFVIAVAGAEEPNDAASDMLTRVQKLRIQNPNACPSGPVVKNWSGKIEGWDKTNRESIAKLEKDLTEARRENKRLRKAAVAAEKSSIKQDARKQKQLSGLRLRYDEVSRQRDGLRRQAETLIGQILLPAGEEKRPFQQAFQAASSMVPVFKEFQRQAPLWRYPGIDVRSSESKPAPEKFAAIDSPEHQKYFVERLEEHREKDFAFTLTEEGRKALSTTFFPIGKIAVHRLAELDAVQEKSRELFAENDRVYADEKKWEASHPDLVKAVHAARDAQDGARVKLNASNERVQRAETALAQARQEAQLHGSLRTMLAKCPREAGAEELAVRSGTEPAVPATH